MSEQEINHLIATQINGWIHDEGIFYHDASGFTCYLADYCNSIAHALDLAKANGVNKFILDGASIKDNIIQTAKNLDAVRELLGSRPIHVNSWYRPGHINARVGGSKFSRHQYGDAVDIRSDYFTPLKIYKTLDAIHLKGGLGKYPNFIHIDWRGVKARW